MKRTLMGTKQWINVCILSLALTSGFHALPVDEEVAFGDSDIDEILRLINELTEEEITIDDVEEAGNEVIDSLGELLEADPEMPSKRFTPSFMEMHMSYPQYQYLVLLQRKARQLDDIIKEAETTSSIESLKQDPRWNRVIEMRDSLAHLIPKRSNQADLQELRSKRSFSVEFMGMQVSYPQYLRLKKLQEKVIRLDRMMRVLEQRNSPETLARLAQWKMLVQLRESLRPLLPPEDGVSDTDGIQSLIDGRRKRSPFSVDFMGMQVSYPQYLRLRALQNKVIQLDKAMRRLREAKTEEELERYPNWHTLQALHASLAKMLPEDYTKQYEDENLRVKRSVDFNGVKVSIPQYARLRALQDKVIRLDTIMQKISASQDPTSLADNPKWIELMQLRESLSKLLPDRRKKSSATMEFNGVQVSYPQYLHLMNLQKKVLKLDAVMERLELSAEDPKHLAANPKWQTLVKLRGALSRLMPKQQTG